MAKQSAADRMNRVNRGCCPIHGIGMENNGWDLDNTVYIVQQAPPLDVPLSERQIDDALNKRLAYQIVKCSRKDCEVRAKMFVRREDNLPDFDGPIELLPEWEYLLEGE